MTDTAEPTSTRRAPVQGGCKWSEVPAWFCTKWRTESDVRVPYGTIPWEDHLRLYELYAARFGHNQTPERISERGGFGVSEYVYFKCDDALERWKPHG